MAESTALAPTRKLDELNLKVKELDALGRAEEYIVGLPTSPNFAEWSFLQQIAMLKTGAWKSIPVPQVAFAIAYANRLGLDIMQGDVYSTGEGRIATSNKAKIKLAMQTGKIVGINSVVTETERPFSADGCAVKKDLECTVTVSVKGWERPLTLTQRLSEWYVGRNPNWKSRPEHMLKLNTLAHACEYINPTETGDDEYLPAPMTQGTVKEQLQREIAGGNVFEGEVVNVE